MSAAHSPGPWAVRFSHSGYPYQIIAPSGDDKKPGVVGTCITRWGSISLPSSDEGLANARLLAAAPELLDALKSLVAGVDAGLDIDGWDERFNAARAAIAKATGEAA